MKIYYSKFIYSLLTAFFFVSVSAAQSQETLWSKSTTDKVKKENVIFYKSIPKNSILLSLNVQALQARLSNAPKRTQSSANEGVVIDFPDQKGNFQSYLVKEASVMSSELQAQFPHIRSYIGKGIDNPASVIRFSISPEKGLSSMLLSDKKTIFIEPYSADLQNYLVFINSIEDGPRTPFECETEYVEPELNISNEAYVALRNADDQTLRTYRLALACTVEYSQYHGGTLAQVTAAMVATMTRVNGVYERDLGITMEMVPNSSIIFLGPNVNSDPYTNNDGSAMLGENQTTCDNVNNIGSANYDIGHVFSTGGGGIAQLFSPCNNNSKARGVTGSFAPTGDAFDIDYVAHEMGHQFGANHTQNNNCQRSNVSVEPGSASTIMGYAGICAPNIQNNSDDYFHGENIKEIWLNISAGTGSTCFTGTSTNNAAPFVNAGANFSIPKSTAFTLKGSAVDADTPFGLTYCWEQTDATPATMPPQSTNTGGPTFRSLDPSSSPNRYMPALPTVMSGSLASTWEVVPSVARDMNFLLTVRDNELNGGATGSSEMMVSVEDVTPFTVVTPPTWGQNTSQQVNWIVGATADPTINCQLVNILFTVNNGATFTTLATEVPNTGSATITVPNIADNNNAKILVEAADNIFYAVSNAFLISDEEDFSIVSLTENQEVCAEDSVTFDFDFITTNGFSENTFFTASGVPAGATTTFTPASLNSDDSFTLTIGNLGATTVGVYDITVTGTSPSLTRTANVVLDRSCTEVVCNPPYATAENLGVAIPDPSGGNAGLVTHTLNIPDSNIIESMTLSLDISHTWISDLQVYILPPGGTFANDAIKLWDNTCAVSSGTGYENFAVTFDDQAAALPGVDGCSDNFTGTYSPSESLSAFTGLDAQGDWQLLVADFFNGDTGTLNSWSIEICYEAPLSIEENKFEDLAVYPNPNNGSFNIAFNPKSDEDIIIEVFDIRGRSIYTKTHYNNISRFEEVIRLNNAQSGVYLLTIANGTQKVTKKIIVE
ncbi:reprolysin-like metallopeptidase [Winogradskyella vidalii]|uniref:reprolysin-like metallopeptidase n=1 Tax=Winogradskyella vidalii TaxID=2615024 RepID=UPI0015CC7BC5|nr:zinc-dependent metalloprotease family protein [Winogradskyella vidalii]